MSNQGRPSNPIEVNYNGQDMILDHGMVGIASITSCIFLMWMVLY
jgi:aconitate hydratase